MPTKVRSQLNDKSNVPLWLLVAFLCILWFSGGASRADAGGQAVTRLFAYLFLVIFIVWTPGFEWRRVRPVAVLLGLSLLLAIFQLVPTPPSFWMALPGREILVRTAAVIGEPQPWRPVSLSPAATYNALGSLVVPITTLALAASLTGEQHRKIASAVLILIAMGALLALLQFSGGWYDNPLTNDVQGSVSGNFANRNHFALFLATGCVLLLVWGFGQTRGERRNTIAAAALLPFFILVLLATGSRMGLLLGGLAIALALLAVRTSITRRFRVNSRRVSIAVVIIIVLAIGAAVALSMFMDRAVSVDRVYDMDVSSDLRSRINPIVISMIRTYFPIGSGIGAFDPVFRIHETDSILQPLYFNRAHNDWLEVVLDAGIFGGALLLVAFGWWAMQSYKVWFGHRSGEMLSKAASIIILLIMLASITDYPARTPMIMAVLTLAAVWLCDGRRARSGPAVPV